jgi:DNA-binding beta-propeller fold protein YncE
MMFGTGKVSFQRATRRLIRPCIVLAVLVAGAAAAAPNAPADPLVVAAQGGFGGAVDITDLTTGTTFTGGLPSFSQGIAITPDGSTAWAVDQDNGITPFHIRPPQSEGTRISGVDGNFAEGIVFTPDGNTMYLEDARSVVPVDLSTDTAGQSIPLGTGLGGLATHVLAISPDGKTIYASYGSLGPNPAQLLTIDVPTNTVTGGIILGGANGDDVAGVVVAPDGTRAYVALRLSGLVVPVDLPSGSVESAIQIPVSQLAGSTGTGCTGFRCPPIQWDDSDIVITPNGRTVYVAGSVNGNSYVIPIDTATNQLGAPIPVSAGSPGLLAMSPDGATLYVVDSVSANSSTLEEVDIASNIVTGSATVPYPIREFAIGTSSSPDTDLNITSVPDISTPASSSSGATVTYSGPTATDEGGETPPVTCDHPSGSTFAVGTTTVTCTATDSDDTPLAVSTSFKVTVTDTDLSIGSPPANITTPAASVNGATVSYRPPAGSDEDGETPMVVCDRSPGSTFPIGTTTVTCTASDPDDTPSSASNSFKVTVFINPPTSKVNVRFHYSADGSAGGWSTATTVSSSGAVTIGPQAMEGNLIVKPGDTLNVGYDFTMPGSHPAATLGFFNTTVTLQAACAPGTGGGTITVNVPAQQYTDPMNSSAWYPSGKQQDPSVYQGSISVPNLCGGGSISLKQGGTFNATVGAL